MVPLGITRDEGFDLAVSSERPPTRPPRQYASTSDCGAACRDNVLAISSHSNHIKGRILVTASRQSLQEAGGEVEICGDTGGQRRSVFQGGFVQ